MYHFLVQTLIRSRGTQRSRVRVFALARNFLDHLRKRKRLKGPLFQLFFGTVRFFSKLFLPSKGPPSSFFDILQQTKGPKSPKGVYFQVLRHYETVSKFSFFVFFEFFCLQISIGRNCGRLKLSTVEMATVEIA